jgi:hypothetical protein
VIRGNSTTADFFVNGVRDDAQFVRDLYNVERVEAVKGSNALIFGRGGAGGVINRVLKDAGFSTVRNDDARRRLIRPQAIHTRCRERRWRSRCAALQRHVREVRRLRENAMLHRFGVIPAPR